VLAREAVLRERDGDLEQLRGAVLTSELLSRSVSTTVSRGRLRIRLLTPIGGIGAGENADRPALSLPSLEPRAALL
jgi:hypothetical protein